jgi:hypothetical protein
VTVVNVHGILMGQEMIYPPFLFFKMSSKRVTPDKAFALLNTKSSGINGLVRIAKRAGTANALPLQAYRT